MDSFTLRLDDLDPTVYQAGLLAGILVDADDGQVGLDAGWFANPGQQLAGAVADRPEALLGLLASLLGSSDPQVLGLPSPSGHGELWYPIADGSGEPTGLYLVCRQEGDFLHFGVGARWSTQVEDSLTISIWGHLPLIKTDGTAGNTAFVLGQGSSYESGSPVKLAVEVTSSDGFGTDQLSFRGIKLAAEVLFSQVPRVSFVFLGLQLPDGQAASDRSLSDLTSIGAREWVEMAISLFVSQLTASADAGVQVVRNHLLPILGLGAGVPSIHWEQLPDRQIGVFRDWLQALIEDTAALRTWLVHWHDLLLDEVNDTAEALALKGTGTRSDPYRVGVPLGGSVMLHLCMAAVIETDGSRTLYPGMWLTTPEVVLADPTTFTFVVATEIPAIRLTNPPGGQPLPSFKAFLRLFNKNGGSLVNHRFDPPSDLAPLGTFSLREIRAGLTLDDAGRPTPMIELVNVNCARGSWPVIDLSSADTVMEHLQSAAGSVIEAQLTNALGGDDTGDHAGRQVAALLGILPPSDPGAPDPWPVELVVAAGNVTDFLGDPLSAVGCYHAACLETQIGGAPAWRFLMHDIAALLHYATVPVPALSGTGSAADPWRQPLYSAAEGDASLLAWTETNAGRPQLHVALDLSLASLDLGGGVNLTAHQQTQILHLDLPPSGACPGPVTVVWLPEVQASVRLAGAGPMVLPAAAGLTLSLTALMLSARWHHQDGFSWSVAIQDPNADWALDNLTLPNLEFGTGDDLSWDLSLPDFGLGLDPVKLGNLFRFTFGFSLFKWGGPFGFGLAGLLGWLPDWPNLSFPGLPSWDSGPFRLPVDWPTFSPINWPAFFANPCPEIRLHLGSLFGDARWAWPALNWLGGLFHFSLPDLALPDLGWPSLGGGDGLSFPSLPFEVTGSGTYPDPWALRLYRTGDQEWQALLWLDPEGPPSGEAVDVMLSLLPDGLQSLGDLIGDDTFTFENLVAILNRLSTVDAGLRDALVAHLPADLAAGLDSLEQFLSGSDGAALCVAQQPVAPTDAAPGDPPWAWNAPAALTDLPEATHWAQLDLPAITAAIKAKVDEWSGAADLPVLLVNAPWEDASAWAAVLAEWGSPPAAHFDLVEFGTDPALISVETVTATGRFYTADLAVVNTAPGVAPADRALPFSGPESSQAAQLSRLLDRIRELHPGQQVIVVAHSTSGLAARAAIQADGDDSRVRGLVTIGTPHLLGALPWLNDPAAREALAFLNRLDPSQIPDATLRQVVEKLLEWVKAPADLGDLTNLPPAPAHLFGDPGPANLPAGVSGHALATRLPVATLRDQLLQWLQARLEGLRAALDGRVAPTHAGFGLRFRDTLALSPDISMRSDVRLDLTRLALDAADDSEYLTLPRLTVRKRITRSNGWLVGGVGTSPRLRFADLGLTLAPGEAVPIVRLYDAHVDGLEQLESGVQALTDGLYELPVFARRTLQEMFAAESAALGPFKSQLAHLGLVESLEDLPGLDTGGWDSLLADPWGYLQGQLNAIMADASRRDGFLAALPGLMGMQAAGLERWLSAPPDDTNAIKALRETLAQLGVLYPESRGYAVNPQALLALLADPKNALTTAANALFDDEGRRLALINKLRTTLGLHDAMPPGDPYDLGHGVSLDVTPAGRVSVSVGAADALPVVPGLRLYGSLTLDLEARTLEISLKLSPPYVDAALAAVYSLQHSAPASLKLQLHLGEGNLPAAYPALDLFPLAADFVDRLGEMLPRALLSTFAGQLLETQLLANRPDAGPLLSNLGLAYRRQDGAPWQVRHLDGLLLDPVQWLLSDEALGDGSGAFDPTVALDAVDNARKTLGLPGPVNTLALPFGMQLRASAPGALRLDLETASDLDLAGNGTLRLDLAFTVATDARVGGGGSVDLRFNLPDVPAAPDLWDQLVIWAGYDGGQFSLKLGTDAVLIGLLPFAGWDAVLQGAGGVVRKLLPTMVKAAVEALDADAALNGFVTNLRAAAAALQIDSEPGLQTLTADPVVWLQGRFSAANAAASATALFDLLNNNGNGLAGIADTGSGLLTYAPAGLSLGRNGQIGVWVSLNGLATGPLTTGLGAHVAIGDTPDLPVDFGVNLDMAVDPDVIQPGGVSIEPSLHFAFAYDGSQDPPLDLDLHLYPLGDAPGSPDFRLNILPSFQFRCDGGAMEDCLLDFARRVLVPLAVEMFLDNPSVTGRTGWLNKALVAGHDNTCPGTILVTVGLLENDGGDGYNLVPIDAPAFPSVEQAVTRLLGEGLNAMQAALAGTPLVDLTTMGGDPGGLYLERKRDDDDMADLYGLRLLIPPRQITSDPEIRLVLGDDPAWIHAAGVPESTDLQSGITLFLLRKQEADFSFQMDLDVVSMGVDLSGKNDALLLEAGGFQLGGVDTRLYLSLKNVTTSANVDFGVFARLNEVGIPLGAASDNAVAQSLLGGGDGGGGENQAVNPSFSVAVAWAGDLYVDLEGQRPNEAWFPIQATFGPVHVDQIGVRWIQDQEQYALSILVDGGVTIEGLAVGFDDLSVTIPVKTILDLGTWSLGLRGLAIAYSGGGVRITGALRQVGKGSSVHYDGLCLVEVSGRTFVAMGSYMRVPFTSMFVFVLLPITIGGPPYLFIIGLAGGFGYNRGLEVPDVAGIPEFPLVAGAHGAVSLSREPMQALIDMGDAIVPRRGSYWIAAGIRFTSFALVDSVALVYVLLDRGLEIGLLGFSQMQLPPEEPLVNIEMALKARFSTIEGVFSVEARLTDNSWLLYRDCRLTGGFAFFMWFGGSHKGDFVISMGGYHPRFSKPSHYPDVPRLGFNWRVSSCVTIKGESYFALTPSCVMAGGLLEAVYKSGDLKAWFTAYADFLISWNPFAYDIEIGVSIGVSYRLKVWLLFGTVTHTFKAELGARLRIWGPELSGEVEVTWWVISFTFGFGAGDDKTDDSAIGWDEFRNGFLPADDDIVAGFVEKGMLEEEEDGDDKRWLLHPEFMLRVETVIATTKIVVGSQEEADGPEVDIRPMHKNDVESTLLVSIRRLGAGGGEEPADALGYQIMTGNVPAALWLFEDRDERPAADVIPSWTGVRLVADIDERTLRRTDELAIKEIFEEGFYPLPFTQEIQARMKVEAGAQIANLLDQVQAFDSGQVLQASRSILGSGDWDARRRSTFETLGGLGYTVPSHLSLNVTRAYLARRRNAPPLIASLYENMAAETHLEVETTPYPDLPQPVQEPFPMVPTLKAVLRVRPEPTGQKNRAVRTTVEEVTNGAELPRISVAALVRTPVMGATLQRQSAPQASRATASASRGAAFVNSRFATAAQRKGFANLQEQAVVVQPSFQPGTNGATAAAIFQEREGVSLQAGATQVWELPSRNTVGEMPTLFYNGSQALRITCLDRGNHLLADVEVAGSGQYTPPRGTARLALSGLGKPAQPGEIGPAMGAVGLEQATHPVVVVGWQSSSELVQVGRSVLLGRSAVLRTGAPMRTRRQGRRVDQALLKATEALKGQTGIETHLPPRVTTVGVFVERDDPATETDLAAGMGITVEGAELASQPVSVVGSGRALLLYDVLSVEEGAGHITVGVAARPGWGIEGVIGLKGSARHWAETLANQPLATLVEDGPLTPQGETRVLFLAKPGEE